MKNITLLLTIICAMAGPFALTQSVLKLSTSGPGTLVTDSVIVNLGGLESFEIRLTDANGQQTLLPAGIHVGDNDLLYLITHPAASGVIFTPTQKLDPLNGVNTWDLFQIDRHISGLEQLPSPYAIIAADADQSGAVTLDDRTLIHNVILGSTESFPNDKSWRLINKKQQFLNPQNPFLAPLQETADPFFTGVFGNSKPYRVDFIPVKIGDVDQTAALNNLVALEDRQLPVFPLDIQDQLVQKGEIVEVTFPGASGIAGYQFTLNTQNLSVITVMPGLHSGPELFRVLPQDQNGNWAAAVAGIVEQGDGDFTIRFTTTADGWLRDMLTMTDEVTPSLAFDQQGTPSKPALIFSTATIQASPTCSPNPWTEATRLTVYIQEDHTTTLRVYTAEGKLAYQKSVFGKKGQQEFILQSTDLGSAGVFYYEIESGAERWTGKMIFKW